MNIAPENLAVKETIQVEFPAALRASPPVESPLTMAAQRFDLNFVDREAPAWQRPKTTTAWRLLAFLPAALMTTGFAYTFYDFFKAEGVNAMEIAIMALTSFAFVWIAIAVGFSIAGATLVGQHLGADDAKGAVRSGWRALGLAIASMILLSAVIALFAEEIARFLMACL